MATSHGPHSPRGKDDSWLLITLAAMDEDEAVRYAVGELRRVAALLAEPGARAPEAPPGPAPGPQGTAAVPPRLGITQDTGSHLAADL
jgi:hypothetical protein